MMVRSGKVALIAGITGQDGAYLARFLLGKGYVVHGTSRDAALARLDGLNAVNIADQITLHSMSPADFQSVAQVIEAVAPDEIYNLSGQSSVALSFTLPAETLAGVTLGTLNMRPFRYRQSTRKNRHCKNALCPADAAASRAREVAESKPLSAAGADPRRCRCHLAGHEAVWPKRRLARRTNRRRSGRRALTAWPWRR